MLMHPEIFGALGDGVHNDGNAIQEAINACCACGGGEVLLSPGKVYLSHYLVLRSQVSLHLEEGAVLRADGAMFCPDRPPHEKGEEEEHLDTGKPAGIFLYALNCREISLYGPGSVEEDTGVQLLYLDACTGMEIRSLHLSGRGDLIGIGGSSRIQIMDCRLSSRCGSAVFVDHGRNLSICGCRMTGGVRICATRAHEKALPSDGIELKDCTMI